MLMLVKEGMPPELAGLARAVQKLLPAFSARTGSRLRFLRGEVAPFATIPFVGDFAGG